MNLFIRWLERVSGMREPPKKEKEQVVVPTWLVGGFERSLAFVLVVFDVPGAYTLLAAWIAAKLAANWQRVPVDNSPEGARSPCKNADRAYRGCRLSWIWMPCWRTDPPHGVRLFL